MQHEGFGHLRRWQVVDCRESPHYDGSAAEPQRPPLVAVTLKPTLARLPHCGAKHNVKAAQFDPYSNK